MSEPSPQPTQKSSSDIELSQRKDEDDVVLRPWRVPTSFKWLAIPTRPSDTADIVWSDGIPMKACYFKCRGWWGTWNYVGPEMPVRDMNAGGPKPVSKPGYHVNPQGTVDVFIASEYVLPNYSTGPTSHYHLRDLVGGDAAAEDERWVTMQLNDCFQFGEGKSNGQLVRFIVYHPPVAAGLKMPAMFQHRFTDAVVDYGRYIDEVSEYLPEEHGIRSSAKAMAKITSFATELGKKALGDKLRTFLPSCAITAVRKQAFIISAAHHELGLPTCVAIVARALELEPPPEVNKVVQENEKSRIAKGMIAIKGLQDKTAWKTEALTSITRAIAEDESARVKALKSIAATPSRQPAATEGGQPSRNPGTKSPKPPVGDEHNGVLSEDEDEMEEEEEVVEDDEYAKTLRDLLDMEGYDEDNAVLLKYSGITPKKPRKKHSRPIATQSPKTKFITRDHEEVRKAKGDKVNSLGEVGDIKGAPQNTSEKAEDMSLADRQNFLKARNLKRANGVNTLINNNASQLPKHG